MPISPFTQPIYVTRPLLPPLEEIYPLLEEIWDSQILTNSGAKHQQLETLLSEFLQTPFSCLFNNGTIALLAACRALRLSGEVITTPFTFPATPHALNWNQLTPVFCDIDPLTMTIDPNKIEKLITSKTSAILGVHVYGIPCHLEAIEAIAKEHRLKVIYDAAHAFGCKINGEGIGSFGDVSMFSFHATKLFHTCEGGCLTVKDSQLKTDIELLKNFGIKNEEQVCFPGINGKLNEVQSAIGLANLKYIEKERSKREQIALHYRRNLSDIPGIELMPEFPSHITPSHQYFIIKINKKKFGLSRDEVHEKLKKWNVITRKYFYPLCSTYECYRLLPSSSPEHLPIAHETANCVLSLPFYGSLSFEDIDKICTIIKSFQK